MCAIFGAVLYKTRNRDIAAVNHLLAHIASESTARGRDGFGWRLQGVRGAHPFVHTQRRPGRIDPTDLPVKFVDAPFDCATLIGNFRAEPTTEFVLEKGLCDQQPYSDKNWSIVHNGTIANDRELRDHTVRTTIDSAAIVETLVRSECPPGLLAFEQCIHLLEGSYAILAQHHNAQASIFVATNYKPVWKIETPWGWFFASNRDYFPGSYPAVMLEPYSVHEFRAIEGARSVYHRQHSLRPVAKRVPRALVVASGGMDSTVAAAHCKYKQMDVELIHFQYGCRAETKEVDAIKNIAAHLDVPVRFQDINVYKPSHSRLFDKDSDIAGGEEGAEFAHEWVPARNLLMLSYAVAIAEAEGFDYIVLGNNLEESGAYPDNEPEFIHKLNDVLPFAVGANKQVEIIMPVGTMMKHEIVKLGLDVCAPLELTWSCYKHGDKHCGKCGPCYMRKTAFEINNTTEVIEYED